MKYLIFFYLIFFTNYTFAYLDPGSGSIIVQALVGAIAAIFFFFKNFWLKLKYIVERFKKFFKRN